MNILLVSATDFEVAPLLFELEPIGDMSKNIKQYTFNQIYVDVLVTGVGIPFTTYQLTLLLAKKSYNFALNLGIAGSFHENISLGSVFNVVSDRFADIGVEDKGKFRSIFEINLKDKDQYPFTGGSLINNTETKNESIQKLQKVSAVTVNKVSGNSETIKNLREYYQPDIETMEGAAFCYVCMMENVPYFQIRSISNFIEERNTKNWNIKLAVENLNKTVLNILKKSI